ncbi:MAG: DUF4340 domain-containing protein, partial [bacterium]|nr:DUF4340 domain-containing protein [bacterium]MDW8163494.1 DUF4340 domain-containing protein [Candidatus Omnitrophota bacterium]
MEILKLDENWIIKDKNYECDKNEITSLIEKISSLEYERNIGNVEDLSLYGLKNPQKLIEIKEDGKKFTLFIGEETPSGSYFYTTTEKKEVLLIYKWDLTGIIEKDVFSLRDKSIIPTDIVKSDLEEIEVRRDKIDFLLQRSGDNWY